MELTDRETALRRVGSEDLLETVVELFVTECPRLLDQIRRAIATGATQELRLAAHTLKGSADMLAIKPVVDAARRLEELGRDGDLVAAPAALRTLEDAVVALHV